MSTPQTPDAELVQPWEKTADERESVETAEQSLFDLLGSDPEFAEEKPKRKRRSTKSEQEDEDPENEDGSQSDEDEGNDDSPDESDFDDEDDDFEDEDDDFDDEYEDGEEDDADDEYDDDDLHVVKVDGEEIEVPYEELVAGYSRTEYLTRTRQKEAAEHRSAMEGVSKAQAEYVEKLELMEQALEQLDPAEPDWEKIQRENPNQFGAIFAAHQKRKQVREAVAAERKAEAEKAAAAQADAQSAYVAEQYELLTRAVPAWRKDQKVMAKEIGEITEFAQNHLGFTQEELAAVNDHRVILALRAARRGFEMETGGKKLLRKKKRSRTLRPSGEKRGRTRKTGKRNRGNAKRIDRRAERVARTGRVQDAVSLFETMLEEGVDL